MFATGLVLVGLCLAAQAIVGDEVWRRRTWRAYLWPGLAFTMGVLMWPVMVFFTNSTIHMLAHGSWAQVMMFSGAAELGLVRGKLHSRYWRLAMPFAFLVSGAAFLIHEQDSWFFAPAAFLALAAPASAWAHATLLQTKPAFAQRVERSPRVVLLRFDQSVEALPNAITVYTSKGHVVSGLTRSTADKRAVTVPVQQLAR